MPIKTDLSTVAILFAIRVKNYTIFGLQYYCSEIKRFIVIVLDLCDSFELKIAIQCSVKPIKI